MKRTEKTNAVSAAVSSPIIKLALLALALLAYATFYARRLVIEHAIFGDMVGKWMQVKRLLAKPGDLSCFYNEVFDPTFRFLPGPHYFYFLDKGTCKYMYPYPYAALVAPFVDLWPDWGFFILNAIAWLPMTFAFFWLGRLTVRRSRHADIYAGLASFFIFPTAVYAFDFSEMMVSLGPWTVALAMVCHALWRTKSPTARTVLLTGAGIISGLLLAMRSEALIFSALLVGAVSLESLRRQSRNLGLATRIWRALQRNSMPVTVGVAAGLLVVLFVQQQLFGHPLGYRGASMLQDRHVITLKEQLGIAWTLLGGGSLGLFSSLPLVWVAFGYCWPGVRRRMPRSTFFAFIAFGGTIAVAVGSPADGGYSWSPRYLAFALPAYCVLVLSVTFSGHRFFRNKVIGGLLLLLCVYSVAYAHKGMKIVIRATKQKAAYAQMLSVPNVTPIILQSRLIYGALPRELLLKQVYYTPTPERLHQLLATIRPPVQHFTLITRTPLLKEWQPAGWMVEKSVPVKGLLFSHFRKR